MFDNNIFIELGNIKLEIEKDLSTINSIKHYLNMKSVTNDSEQLSTKMTIINKDLTNNIEDLKKQNAQLQKELIRMGNANESKEKELNKLKSQISVISIEKEEADSELQKIMKENEALRKQIIDKDQYKELHQMNIDYLKQLYS